MTVQTPFAELELEDGRKVTTAIIRNADSGLIHVVVEVDDPRSNNDVVILGMILVPEILLPAREFPNPPSTLRVV